MTQVLVALIALIPAVLAYSNRQASKLARIQQEVELLKAIPEDMADEKVRLKLQIKRSVFIYSQTQKRDRWPLIQGYGFSLSGLVTMLGLQLYSEGVLGSSASQVSNRELAGIIILVVGGLGLTSFGILYLADAKDRVKKMISERRKIRAQLDLNESLEKESRQVG